MLSDKLSEEAGRDSQCTLQHHQLIAGIMEQHLAARTRVTTRQPLMSIGLM